MSFAARLRAATWNDHSSAEQTTFLDDLTRGRLTLAAHADLTVQHYLIYEALEESACELHSPELTRLPSLQQDLEFLIGPHWPDALVPSAATAAYAARIREVAQQWPAGLVAHHYNRYLGDLSGGQYVARAIGKAYQLQQDGLRFYRFDIADFDAFKNAYRARLDAAPWDESEQDRIIDEVKLAYQYNCDVLAELGAVHKPPFPPEVVAQIMRHMNDDHAADSLLICHAFGGQPTATDALMSGMDADGIEFRVTVGGAPIGVRVPFGQRLTERAQVRVEVTRLYHEARTHLGLPAPMDKP